MRNWPQLLHTILVASPFSPPLESPSLPSGIRKRQTGPAAAAALAGSFAATLRLKLPALEGRLLELDLIMSCPLEFCPNSALIRLTRDHPGLKSLRPGGGIDALGFLDSALMRYFLRKWKRELRSHGE